MDSTIGLTIQCVGIGLVTVLMVFMRASIRSSSLRYWTTAWACLALALAILLIGFHVNADQKIFFSLYFFGEYVFGLMFFAGCRYHSTGEGLDRGLVGSLFVALLTAVALPFLSIDFNDLFMMHSVLMSGLFAASFWQLRIVRTRREVTPGIRVMSMALWLLAVDFLHYVPVFGARKGLWGYTVPLAYLRYTSIVDLILEILLGFGTVMVLMEVVRREIEATNKQLTDAHETLQLLARMDPLTEALNRHAFHSLLSRNEDGVESLVSGSVAVIDIDNLKPINDTFGHAVGDRAIRAVARAVRSLIRADDMLFRWGGDEFMVLMIKLDEAEASRRMQQLNEILEENAAQWTSVEVKISVSFGVAGFNELAQLGDAIEEADRAMYSRRKVVRGKRRELSTSKEMQRIGT